MEIMEQQENSNAIQVLDKGFVRYINHMGGDLTVVNAARVSFAKESRLDSSGNLVSGDQKLINYLAKHKHWTPFAHPQICLHIKAPIAIRAQLGKHQIGLVMNEVSRRYVKDEPEYYVPTWRSAPTDGAKQGSSDFMIGTTMQDETYRNACDDALDTYRELLSAVWHQNRQDSLYHRELIRSGGGLDPCQPMPVCAS